MGVAVPTDIHVPQKKTTSLHPYYIADYHSSPPHSRHWGWCIEDSHTKLGHQNCLQTLWSAEEQSVDLQGRSTHMNVIISCNYDNTNIKYTWSLGTSYNLLYSACKESIYMYMYNTCMLYTHILWTNLSLSERHLHQQPKTANPSLSAWFHTLILMYMYTS